MKRIDWYAKYNAWFQRNRQKLEARNRHDNEVGKMVDITYQAYRAGWLAGRRAEKSEPAQL